MVVVAAAGESHCFGWLALLDPVDSWVCVLSNPVKQFGPRKDKNTAIMACVQHRAPFIVK
jgi:hypothetical protein